MANDETIFICGGPRGGFTVLYASAPAAELLGRPAETCLGNPFVDLLASLPDDQRHDLSAALSMPRPIFQHLDIATGSAIGARYELAAWPAPQDGDAPTIWVIRLREQGLNTDPPPIDLEFADGLAIGLVLFDAADRLVWFNGTYLRVLGPNGHLLQIGERFEDIMSAAYRSGHAAAADGDIEDRIAERLARHRNYESFEEALSGGRWLLTQEIATADGGTLGVRTDITEIKRNENAPG